MLLQMETIYLHVANSLKNVVLKFEGEGTLLCDSIL